MVDAGEVKLYANRQALLRLARKLDAMAAAVPEDCFEIHVSSEFYQANDRFDRTIEPRMNAFMLSMRQAELERLKLAGELDLDAALAPFELTIVHISDEAIEEERRRIQTSEVASSEALPAPL